MEFCILWQVNFLNPINGTIDGCVYLTEEQVDEMLLEAEQDINLRSSDKKRRRKRAFVNFNVNPFLLWPHKYPIEYKFDGEHSKWRLG